jgi:dephospho-CoA kinase
MVDPLVALFPGLARNGYVVTSPADVVYNCIAWAAERTGEWWWPEARRLRGYWPAGVPQETTVAAFQAAFATLGYAQCGTEDLEQGFTKVALFADSRGAVQHAARQLPSGRWTSKIGELQDIEHALRDLEGDEYGLAVLVMKRVTRPKHVLGLIGGIGSGKSAVADAFARLGGAVVSGDKLGHEALMRTEVIAAVTKRWGPGVLATDGSVDRRKLGAIVFADPAERRALEALVFPVIEAGIAAGIAAAQTNPKAAFIVLDAAVMLEAGWNKFCDRIVYIDAPREVRLARLANLRGWSAKEVQDREAAQLPLSDKASRADTVLDNSGTPADLAPRAARLLREWSFPVASGAGFLDNT